MCFSTTGREIAATTSSLSANRQAGTEVGQRQNLEGQNTFREMESTVSFPSGGVERRYLLESAPAKTPYWFVSCRTIPWPTMVSVWNGWLRAVVVD